jgi:hypothetical protein
VEKELLVRTAVRIAIACLTALAAVLVALPARDAFA